VEGGVRTAGARGSCRLVGVMRTIDGGAQSVDTTGLQEFNEVKLCRRGGVRSTAGLAMSQTCQKRL
jgi:hypothetical protein